MKFRSQKSDGNGRQRWVTVGECRRGAPASSPDSESGQAGRKGLTTKERSKEGLNRLKAGMGVDGTKYDHSESEVALSSK
jgi:hypothetical protein